MATSHASIAVDLGRNAAIASAKSLRQEMTCVLADICAGSLSFSDVLNKRNNHEATNRLYLVKALESVASIGKIKARRIMADLKITEKRRIESLSSQEREELLKRIKALV